MQKIVTNIYKTRFKINFSKSVSPFVFKKEAAPVVLPPFRKALIGYAAK